MTISELLKKCRKVITGCKTHEQLDTAWEYGDLVAKKLPYPFNETVLDMLIIQIPIVEKEARRNRVNNTTQTHNLSLGQLARSYSGYEILDTTQINISETKG